MLPRVVAFIPSHNEEMLLPDAIRSLEAQIAALERIIVVSDNSTDGTSAVAAAWGGRVSVIDTIANRDRKAGALNQALAAFLPTLEAEDWVLVMDADSQLVPNFVARALEETRSDPLVGAVGGIFLADRVSNPLGLLQANEYTRYAREIGRDRARARVLTGTATIARVSALRLVAEARNAGHLPGSGVYNPRALCEDFELTVALKRLGYRCTSPRECLVLTELMQTPSSLWRQRTRWQRGAIQTLRFHGFSRVTLPYIVKQAEMVIGQVMLSVLLVVTSWSVWTGNLEWRPVWALFGLVFYLERLVSVWRGGTTSRLLAAAFVPELAYDFFLTAVHVWVWILVATKTQETWGAPSIDKMTSPG